MEHNDDFLRAEIFNTKNIKSGITFDVNNIFITVKEFVFSNQLNMMVSIAEFSNGNLVLINRDGETMLDIDPN